MLLLASCSTDKTKNTEDRRKLYVGKWDFSDAQSPLVDQGTTGTMEERRQIFRDQLADNIIVFNSDSTFFIKLLHGSPVVIGRWQINEVDSVLNFEITNNYDLPFSINFTDVSTDELKCRLSLPYNLGETPKIINLTFRKNDPRFEDSEYNFAKYELNDWRIKADKKLSREEMLNRVRKSFDFAICYLKYSNANVTGNQAHTSLMSLPFYFANNGVELNKVQEWDALFLDEEDARTSYGIVSDAMLRSMKKSQPEDIASKSPIEKNLYILEQIHEELK